MKDYVKDFYYLASFATDWYPVELLDISSTDSMNWYWTYPSRIDFKYHTYHEVW